MLSIVSHGSADSRHAGREGRYADPHIHVAYKVDDVEAPHDRLKSAGYKDSTVLNACPHRKRV
jgi:hypothetical protein